MTNIKATTLTIASLFLLSFFSISSLANNTDTEELTVIGKRRQDTYERRVNVIDQGNGYQTAQQKRYKDCMKTRTSINKACLATAEADLKETQLICGEIAAAGAFTTAMALNWEAKGKSKNIKNTLIILGSLSAPVSAYCYTYASTQKSSHDAKCGRDFEENLEICSAILGRNM